MATKEELKQIFVTGAIPTEEDFHNLIDVAGEQGPAGKDGKDGEQGPAGKDGKDGADGAKGDPGADGKDGFGTKEQYEDIVSRLEVLEDAIMEGGED